MLVAASGYSQTYNYYYGNIHAHTGYSDGNKDSSTSGIGQPGPAFRFAKQSYNFNFLGISEHNHSGAGMQLADYAKGMYQADTANQNGTFVCMYGMEYGVINNGGHVVIYGIDSLIGWETNNYKIYNSEYDYTSLWKLIARRPKAFATVAHPSDSDFGNLANSSWVDTADLAIVGCPIRSGAAFSTTTDYSDAAPGTVYDNYWRKLLARGYKLGATIDHDNHYTTFGRTAHSRTVVLASTLNRDTIMDAYRKMRFYASDDWNVKVNFTINAYPIGSVFNTSIDPAINLQVTDPDAGDDVSNWQIYYGVPGSLSLSTILTSGTTSTATYTHNINVGETYYYYAVITQADGQKIWTSPIWVTKTAVSLPLSLTNFTGTVAGNTIRLDAGFRQGNYDHVIIEKGFRGNDFRALANIPYSTISNRLQLSFVDNNPAEGYQYYRLVFVDVNGQPNYSSVVAVDFSNRSYQVRGNISGNQLNIWVSSATAGKAMVQVYNNAGMLVLKQEISVVNGSSLSSLSLPATSAETYHVVVNYNNGLMRETAIIGLH